MKPTDIIPALEDFMMHVVLATGLSETIIRELVVRYMADAVPEPIVFPRAPSSDGAGK